MATYKTIYYKNKDGSISTNSVLAGDVGYYESQGWTQTNPSSSGSTSTSLPTKYLYIKDDKYYDNTGKHIKDFSTVKELVKDGYKDYGKNYPSNVTPPKEEKATVAPETATEKGETVTRVFIKTPQGIESTYQKGAELESFLKTGWTTNPDGVTPAPTQGDTTKKVEDITKPEDTTIKNIDPAKAKSVNELYQKYFDRDATEAELANWTNVNNPTALEQFLQKDAKIYGYTSKFFQQQYDQATQDAVKNFQERGKLLGWPQDIIDLGVLAIQNYPKGKAIQTDEIINTFNKIKNETVDPYFKELSNIAIKDFQSARDYQATERERELEQQNTIAGQNIKQAKEGLEKSGMTFTGKGIEQLGANSAYAQQGSTPTPEQTPFGGLFYEGTVNQANRLAATSTAARYAQQQQQLGRSAENMLGTEGAGILGINYEPAGVSQTGTLASQRQEKLASTLQDIINQQKQKDLLTTSDINKN